MAKGGRRQGAGRPMGSRDRIPRGRNGLDQLKHMVREAEGAEYLYTNEEKIFDGTMLGFIQAVVRCEALPVKIRLYAANKAVEYEAAAGTPQFDPATGAVVILPSNGRDPDFEQKNLEENREWVAGEFRKRHKAWLFECDAQFHEWIASGEMTERQVLLFRGLITDPGDPPWEPVNTGHTRIQRH